MTELDTFEAAFLGGDRKQALSVLSALIQQAATASGTRDALLAALIPRLGHPHPGLRSYLALAGGALIESGAPARELAIALIEPVRRALTEAGRMLTHFVELGADAGDGSIGVSREMLDAIAERDPVAVQAWASMDMWYRPAVAAWTRETGVLQDVQRDAALRTALAALGHTTETTHWLSLLIETPFAARFVILFPELGTTEPVIVDGVNDLGQLCVLLSDLLRDPLAAIGAPAAPEPGLLDVMRGIGPQQTDLGWQCGFHCYRREALDPADGLPKDGKDTWRAPGGTGHHSLPPDFLPGTLTPTADGTRTLVVVGPNAPGGMRFLRMIAGVRTFDKLRASVTRPDPG